MKMILMILIGLSSASFAFADCGAIAYSAANSRVGWSYGYDSASAAESAAQTSCGAGSVAVAWVCGGLTAALATGDNGAWGTSGASSNVASACAVAIAQCNSVGSNCTCIRWVTTSID